MNMDLAAYLTRIGFDATPSADVAILDAIVWAHLRNVPFENLDIRPLRRPIDLTLGSLYRKIVANRRGGFCYELNGLLAAILNDLGFDARMSSAQFVRAENTLSPPFDHMVLIVRVPGEAVPHLVDAGGASGSPPCSLPLRDGYEVVRDETRCAYRIAANGNRWQMDRREFGGEWTPEYRFADESRTVDEFAARCRYQESDPGSHFVKGPLCTRNFPGGRISIAGGSLIELRNGVRSETPIASDAELRELLVTHFGVVLD